nr:hypothetical protein [Tanacetum cinerariifolium]
MKDEHLDTILKIESDEFIKSSVENLVPNPSESKDLSNSECDVPAYEDFTTFSDLLFNDDDDFSSSNDKSFFDENIPKEIYSNPLFDEEIVSIEIDPHHFNAESDLIESLLDQDSLIISSSSKIDFLLDEFAGELIFPKSIPPGIDETDCDPEEEIPIAITLDLPTMEPKDSLRMEDEHLDTILKIESDEFIKSSVENLVPNPSESKDLSNSECDVPAYEDFTTFSDLLFNDDDDFSSSNDKSFFDENIPKEIYSNPLFDEEIVSIEIDPHHFNAESDLIESLLDQDSLIISSSSKIDFLLDEFAGELIFPKSIPPGIDETDCDPEEEIRLIEKLLYDNSSPRPPKEFIFENSDAAIESFSPPPIPVKDSDSLMEEIDLSFTPDDSMPPGIEDDDYDSERDILILEELLSNDSLSLLKNELFHFDIPSSPRPSAKPPDDKIKPNSGMLTVKVVGDISEHYVHMTRILPNQPTFASNQEKSLHLLSHWGLKAFQLPLESPVMIYGENIPILDVPFFHFYPL